MHRGTDLPTLAARIQAIAASARDFIMPANHLRMTPAGELAWQSGAEGLMLPTNRVADQQLSSYCEIPREYYERMPASLRAINANHWLDAHGTEKRLLRTAEGRVRALLSDRYRPLDNYDLASHVLPIIAEQGMRVESCDLTDTNLYLKCISPTTREATPGDGGHQPGVIIRNSEVGHGALSVTPMVFTLVCKNGLIRWEESRRKYHVGDKRKTEGLAHALEVYCDDTRKKMDSALWAQVADNVRAAISETYFEASLGKIRAAKEGEALRAPEKACELARRAFSLTEVEAGGILAALAKGGDLSRLGFLNAVTRYAQDVESYDRSTELEALGGRILEMNSGEWSALARA